MYRKVVQTKDIKVLKDLMGHYSSAPVKDYSKWDEPGALLYTGGTAGGGHDQGFEGLYRCDFV
jgi:hypothetical protein